MLPEKRIPTHPGKVLAAEFLAPLELSQVDFARHLRIPVQRLNEVIRGKRGVTPETAWLLSRAVGTSWEFWLNLQAAHDLARSQPPRGTSRVTPLRRRPPEQPRVVFRKKRGTR